MIGALLGGKFEIVRLMGQGGMGVVYEARDRDTGARVAIKTLERGLSARAEHLGVRFRREARAAMTLDGPNVVRVFEHGAEDDVLFLVMEYLEGEDLQQVLERRALPLPIALTIVAQACAGLELAHEHGIVHRDVKPANLFLARDGDRLIVKVLDFGVAKLKMEEAHLPGGSLVTQTGMLVGSPLYMSPEQARGVRHIDRRTDVWSLGVVLYRALSGRAPHEGIDAFGDLIMAICTTAPAPLQSVAPTVPDDIAAIVSRALQIDPDARFPTAAAMGEAIARAAPDGAQLSLELLGPTPSVPRPRLSAGAADDVTQTLPQVPTVAASRASETPRAPDPLPSSPPPPPPEARRGARSWWRPAVLVAASLAVTGGLLGLRVGAGDHPLPDAGASSSATPAPTATTLADLPLSDDCQAPAREVYRAGMKALHDGRWDDAHARFVRATELDPTCAEAHLRHVLTGLGRYPVPKLREVYRGAVEVRDRLTERDRLYLEAFEPVVRHDPPDPKELARRLQQLAERFPGDAELVYTAGYYAGYGAGDLSYKIDSSRKAIALDPRYSDAWQTLGEALDKAGQTEEAIVALDRCLAVAPNSFDCALERFDALARAGRCEPALAAARSLVALAPDAAKGYECLAVALTATGAADEAVEEALHQRWHLLSPRTRGPIERQETALLGALRGDLEGAAKSARQSAHDLEADPDLGARLSPTLLLIESLLELRQRDAVGAIADDFFKRATVWQANLSRDAVTRTQFYLEPLLLGASRRAGPVWERDWRARRDRWLTSASKTGMLSEGSSWALGVAMLAQTREEAVEALTSMPPSLVSSGGNVRSPQAPLAGAFVGRTLLLADRTDEAIPFLRAATASCLALQDPFGHTRTHLWLGQALERKGDKAGACAAYSVVLQRWGRASPLAATASSARERASALACPP